MRKYILLFVFINIFPGVLLSQDTLRAGKLFQHEAGIQANELIRQLVNFGENNLEINNPYLLTYSVFHNKTKWGLQAGIGYDYNRIVDRFTAANHESKTHTLNYRIGLARYFKIAKRWECTVGADFAMKYVQNKVATFSIIENINFSDSTATLSNNIIKSTGGGLQLRLGYKINERISLSTEATFYYFDNDDKTNVLIAQTTTFPFNQLNNTYSLTVSNSDIGSSDFKIMLPVAIFLNIKF